MENVFAYTADGTSYPAYISVNRVAGAQPVEYTVAVRSQGAQNAQTISLTPEQMEALALGILAELGSGI